MKNIGIIFLIVVSLFCEAYTQADKPQNKKRLNIWSAVNISKVYKRQDEKYSWNGDNSTLYGIDVGLNINEKDIIFGGYLGYQFAAFEEKGLMLYSDWSKDVVHCVRVGSNIAYQYPVGSIKVYAKGEIGYKLIYIVGNPPLGNSFFFGIYLGSKFSISEKQEIFAEVGYLPELHKYKFVGEGMYKGYDAITLRIGMNLN